TRARRGRAGRVGAGRRRPDCPDAVAREERPVTTPIVPAPPPSALPPIEVVGDADGPLYALAPELAIDTAVAERVIGVFIRGQLRQAGFERALLGLSGGIDSALVAFLAADAIGASNLLCVSMPYATSSP